MGTRTTQPQEAPTSSLERVFTLTNIGGMHLRTAHTFTHTLARMDCDVWVSKAEAPQSAKVNGKSVLGLITLEANKGTRLVIAIEGPDAARAMEHVEQLFATRFGEE